MFYIYVAETYLRKVTENQLRQIKEGFGYSFTIHVHTKGDG